MAVITISRQVAALGDEIASDLAKKIGYTFIDRKQIEKRIVELGFPKEKLEKYDVRATAFIIGTKRGKHWAQTDYKHVWLESHSYDMHRPGGNIGHGGIFTALSYEDALADLNKSIELLGSGDAFAYPFGDYNDQCLKVVEDAGFLCAFTTEYGKIHPGDNPMKLTRVRVNGSPSLKEFKSLL